MQARTKKPRPPNNRRSQSKEQIRHVEPYVRFRRQITAGIKATMICQQKPHAKPDASAPPIAASAKLSFKTG